MSPDFDLVLDECLGRLRAGESGEACLAHHPAEAGRLRPLLSTATWVRRLPAPRSSPEALIAGRERLLAAARVYQPPEAGVVRPVSSELLSRYSVRIVTALRDLLIGKETRGMKLVLRVALNLMVVIVVTSVLTITASANSLPGDALYGVKRTWEEVRLGLTLDPQARSAIERQYAAERQEEIRTLVGLGREVALELEGRLEALEPGRWIVSGLALQVNDQTVVEGTPTVGLIVQAHVRVQGNGGLLALRLKVMTHTGAPIVPVPERSSTPRGASSPANHGNAPTDDTPWPTPEMSHTPQHRAQPTAEHTQMPGHTPEHTPWATPISTHTPEYMPPAHTPEHTPWATQMPEHTPDHDPEHKLLPSATQMSVHSPEHPPEHMPGATEPHDGP